MACSRAVGRPAAAGWGTAPARAAPQRRLPQPRAIVGVDLGTSNSCVAFIKDGEAQVLPLGPDGDASVPSVVAFTKDGAMLVGQDALEPAPELQVAPADCFHSFKRLLGRTLEEVEDEASRLGYEVGIGDRGEAMAYSPIQDDMLAPEELSTWLLEHLRTKAEAHLGEPVTGAVVTVPARFTVRQQGITHDAAEKAGIPEVQLLQEPVAAALAYGINGGTDGDTVLVFDVGGGTFDVSILQAFEGILEVLGTAGDAALGGNDFDRRLSDWLLEQCDAAGVAPPAQGAHFAHLRERQGWALEAAEAAKIALSAAGSGGSASIELPGGAGTVELTEARLEEVTAPLFQLMANVLEALGDALFVEWAVRPSDAVPGAAASAAAAAAPSSGDSEASSSSDGSDQEQQQQQQARDRWAPPPRRITQVALVGQLTRLPSVQRFVARCTGVQPEMGVDPAAAVALGAAIHAGVLLGEVKGVELMDGSYSQDLHDRATGFSGWQP